MRVDLPAKSGTKNLPDVAVGAVAALTPPVAEMAANKAARKIVGDFTIANMSNPPLVVYGVDPA